MTLKNLCREAICFLWRTLTGEERTEDLPPPIPQLPDSVSPDSVLFSEPDCSFCSRSSWILSLEIKPQSLIHTFIDISSRILWLPETLHPHSTRLSSSSVSSKNLSRASFPASLLCLRNFQTSLHLTSPAYCYKQFCHSHVIPSLYALFPGSLFLPNKLWWSRMKANTISSAPVLDLACDGFEQHPDISSIPRSVGWVWELRYLCFWLNIHISSGFRYWSPLSNAVVSRGRWGLWEGLGLWE